MNTNRNRPGGQTSRDKLYSRQKKLEQRIDSLERYIRRLNFKIETESIRYKAATKKGETSKNFGWLKTLLTRREKAERKLEQSKKEYERLQKGSSISPPTGMRKNKEARKKLDGEHPRKPVDTGKAVSCQSSGERFSPKSQAVRNQVNTQGTESGNTNILKVKCPFCPDTEVRKDRIDLHMRKVHPRGAHQSDSKPTEASKERKVPQRPTSPIDRQVWEQVEQLADKDFELLTVEKTAVQGRLRYLAKLSKQLVPRAFSLADQCVLFTGDGPYEAHRLVELLPDVAKSYVNTSAPQRTPFNVVVVGKEAFYGDLMKQAVIHGSEPPRFIPQEGFIDELLFGRDWWNEEITLLNAALASHPGLRYARSLENLPELRRSANLEERFRWPSTEAEESKMLVRDEVDYRDRTPLFELGYRITGVNRNQRWEVLVRAVAKLGLREVAETIARHCRDRKRQRGGRNKFAHAIEEWEHDLGRLKASYYDVSIKRFRWPSTEP